jgi:hypothetical protein
MKLWLGAIWMAATLGVLGGISACGGDDDGGGTPDAGGSGDGGGGGGQAPVISQVRWQREGACVPNDQSGYRITTTFSDPDTDNTSITVRGSVSSCSPNPFTGSPAVITCPNQAPYAGSVTVSDPQNNRDTATFTIEVCRDGTVNP